MQSKYVVTENLVGVAVQDKSVIVSEKQSVAVSVEELLSCLLRTEQRAEGVHKHRKRLTTQRVGDY